MSFVVRARKSRTRGDKVGAVLTLVAGLRREPGRDDAVDLLVEMVRDEANPEGVEHEIAQILAPRHDRDAILSEMVAGLRRREHDRAADCLVSEGERRGIRFIAPPEPEPEPDPEPEPEPEPEPVAESDVEAPPEPAPAPPPDDALASAAEASPEAQIGRDESVETPAQVRAREAVERGREDRRRKARKRALAVVLVGLLVGAAAVGHLVWKESNRTAEVAEVERGIAHFNTFDTTRPALGDAPATLPELAERIAFATALADPGEASRDETWETEWGWSAAALAHLHSGNLEKAIELTTKAERLYPNAVPAIWARARLEERRGNLAEAKSAAHRVLDRYAAFTPARELLVRSAARRLEFDDLRAIVNRLIEVAPEHPYGALLSLRTPEHALLGGPEDASTEAEPVIDAERADTFLRAVVAYKSAVSPAMRANPAAVATAAAEAVRLDPGFAAAHLVLGSARAAQGDPEAAATVFRNAADAGASSSPQLRTLIQAAAPLALAGAGRPDLAGEFTTPFVRLRAQRVTDELDARVAESRPRLLRKPALPDAATVPAAVEALYARVEVLRASGAYETAVATLRELDRHGVDPARARVLAKVLALETASATGWEPELQGETAQRVVAVGEDYAAGRLRSVVDASREGLPDWGARIVYRMQLGALLSLRRFDAAAGALDATTVGLAHQAWRQGLRLRTHARRGRDNEPYEELAASLSAAQPTSVDRLLDLAAGALWQGDLATAEKWLDEVGKRDEGNREAAWICALVNHARERVDDATACFARSGRVYETSPDLLVELGALLLDRRKWDDARAMFQQALLADRDHFDAARGLGEAYSHLSADTAKRDLERIIASYPDSPASAAIRGELMKWLAVADTQ